MSKIVPLISSGTCGPLGVLQLPRLWLKASLEATGQLHEDYPSCGEGYDAMVLNALGLDREVFLAFIKEKKPTYCETEAWILEQKGGSLDPVAVKELNDAISGYIHADDTRTEILDSCCISHEGACRDAVNLNNLDDWKIFHDTTLA